MELKFADRVQIDKEVLRKTTILYTKGKWHCPICGLSYKQTHFIKESCEYCGSSLEKQW